MADDVHVLRIVLDTNHLMVGFLSMFFETGDLLQCYEIKTGDNAFPDTISLSGN